MNRVLNLTVFFLIAVSLTACEKYERSGYPVVKAGPDILIVLPTDTTTLNGSGFDPDGSIVRYQWSKVSGPNAFTIASPASAVTMLVNLEAGLYEFELKVTDKEGHSATDKAVVKVEDVPRPVINMQLVEIGKLSESRYGVAVAAAGEKILFAGGHNGNKYFSTVDIYDIPTQTWSVAQLSEARTGIAAVAIGNKILFAGGVKQFDYYDGWQNASSRVDIFDISSNTWTITELPESRDFFYDQKGAGAGNKAFFAGLYEINGATNVYMYDIASGSGTTLPLGIKRNGYVISSAGNKVFIAGGSTASEEATKNVEVYDAVSNVWTMDSLSEGRNLLKTATTGDRAFFAGGYAVYEPFSNKVDIYNSNTQSWTATHLSRSTVVSGISFAGQRALFFAGKRVDIYDIATNKWYIADIPQSFSDYDSFISAGANAYAVKGGQVWRVQF